MTASRRLFNLLTLAASVCVAAAFGLSSAPVAAQSQPRELNVNVFPGGFNWPIWVAQEQGFFAKHGLKITTIDTPNSRAQLVGLIEESSMSP